MVALSAALLLSVSLLAPARAEEPAPTTDEMAALRERLRQLEGEVDALRAAQAEPEVNNEELPIDLETQVHGYAAVAAEAGEGEAGGVHVEDLIFIYSANLDRKYAFYSEVAMEPEADATSLDIETLELRLRFDPRFGLVVGRVHAPNGWWTSTALHGAYRYLPAEVPHIMVLEDHGGGYIPMHQAGVFAQGALPLGLWQLQYYGGLSNGRSPLIGGIAQVGDEDWAKAVVGRVSLASPGGVLIGVGGHTDTIEPGDAADKFPGRTVLSQPTSENVLSAHFIVQASRLQVATEAFWMRHGLDGQDPVNNQAAYALVGVESGAVTPYVMVDGVWVDPTDPLYSITGNTTDILEGSVGIRYDIGLRLALKVQADYVREAEPVYNTDGSYTDKVESSPGAVVQLSGGF